MINSKSEKAEFISALFDGENFMEHRTELDRDSVDHMQNYSLIGAVLRNELSSPSVKMDFASDVMNTIMTNKIVPEGQNKVKVIKFPSFKMTFKKVGFSIAQLAVAASVAAVTVIGYQTYNADGQSLADDRSTVSLGPVESVNLASYQSDRQAREIELNSRQKEENSVALNNQELQKQQELEVERINNYIRGYVFDTASN
ncbi:MAG: sigma-E factor negative regulatory protein [Succinivibrio sp.]